jgi:hypothetical protein
MHYRPLSGELDTLFRFPYPHVPINASVRQ